MTPLSKSWASIAMRGSAQVELRCVERTGRKKTKHSESEQVEMVVTGGRQGPQKKCGRPRRAPVAVMVEHRSACELVLKEGK